jgi:hypothetical protein
MADGEVILAPMVGAEFDGAALPSDWSSAAWAAGGTASIANGALTVNGALTGTLAQFSPGRALEFVATFSGAANQHVGFGVDFNAAPWAMFSTRSGGSLYARTWVGSTNSNTLIPGNWLGTPHRYRIEWNATDVVYSIDGTVVATHAGAITQSLRPLASDYSVGGGAVAVDWVRMSPYAASGTFTSRVFDAGRVATWGTASWTSEVPGGTSLVIRVRMGSTPIPDGTWTPFGASLSAGAVIGGSSRYIQYRAELATTVPGQTPVLRDINIDSVGELL